jgi:hypothetical protein
MDVALWFVFGLICWALSVAFEQLERDEAAQGDR